MGAKWFPRILGTTWFAYEFPGLDARVWTARPLPGAWPLAAMAALAAWPDLQSVCVCVKVMTTTLEACSRLPATADTTVRYVFTQWSRFYSSNKSDEYERYQEFLGSLEYCFFADRSLPYSTAAAERETPMTRFYKEVFAPLNELQKKKLRNLTESSSVVSQPV